MYLQVQGKEAGLKLRCSVLMDLLSEGPQQIYRRALFRLENAQKRSNAKIKDQQSLCLMMVNITFLQTNMNAECQSCTDVCTPSSSSQRCFENIAVLTQGGPRKRGRPRKFIAAPFLDGRPARALSMDPFDLKGPKRRRGRPKKQQSFDHGAVVEPENAPEKADAQSSPAQHLNCFDKFPCSSCKGNMSIGTKLFEMYC